VGQEGRNALLGMWEGKSGMNAHTPAYELYRVILDYEALQDGFADRIDDLNTTLEQIEMAGDMARGNAQKLLTKNPGKSWDSHKAGGKRTFGWESLGKMLKGTGLALVLVVDDERFAPLKEQLAPRKRPKPAAAASIAANQQDMAVLSQQLLKDHMRKLGAKGNQNGAASNGGKRRAKAMSKRARQRVAAHAARMRWAKRGKVNLG
jgi:hypothetical protein